MDTTTTFRVGDLVRHNPDLIDLTSGERVGLVVETEVVENYDWNHVVPPGGTVVTVNWPDGVILEDPHDLLKVFSDD